MQTDSSGYDRKQAVAGKNSGVTGDENQPTVEGSPRGQRVYNRWSGHGKLYETVMNMAASLREDAFAELSLQPGETVLDLGCGPGINFPLLRDGVGPDGTVVGLDYSPGMTERATARIQEEGWSNVHVVRGDATRTVVAPAVFDAAVTTFALHTMEDAEAVVENVHAALAPGGRFVVLDSRAIQDWPARVLNPLFERVLAQLVNHQPDEQPLTVLRNTFETVDIVETCDAGSGYLAVARKSSTGN